MNDLVWKEQKDSSAVKQKTEVEHRTKKKPQGKLWSNKWSFSNSQKGIGRCNIVGLKP